MFIKVTARAVNLPSDPDRKPRTRSDEDLFLSFKSIQVNPIYPTPEHEARDMVGLARRGNAIEEIRGLINVTPAQQKWLLTVTEGDPLRRETVRRAIQFRQDVRRIFERLLLEPEPITATVDNVEGETCFGCTTGEADPSNDYELA